MSKPLNQSSLPANDFIKPQRLAEQAAETPIAVLDEIFRQEKLSHKKEKYLDWFNVAMTNDDCAYGEAEQRAGLLTFYQEFLSLLEALYIIYSNQSGYSELIPSQEDKPVLLSKQQLSDPMIVVTAFYSQFSIEYVRRELRDWLEAGITFTGSYPENMNAAESLYNYEEVSCLTEAAYALLSKTPANKQATPGNLVADDTLKSLISIIVECCNPDYIFELYMDSTRSGEEKIDCKLLILLPGSSAQSFNAYENVILEKSNGVVTPSLFFKKTIDAYQYLEQGSIFYAVLYNLEKLLYKRSSDPLPQFPLINCDQVAEMAQSKFLSRFEMAQSFLHGARYYCTTDQVKTAAFMLHQAAEHSFRALLYSLIGHNNYEHNLPKLLYRCTFCAPELSNIFPQNTEEEKRLLQLLNAAYVGTRYRNNYEITTEEVMQLLDRVDQLQTEVEQFFKESIIVFKTLCQAI